MCFLPNHSSLLPSYLMMLKAVPMVGRCRFWHWDLGLYVLECDGVGVDAVRRVRRLGRLGGSPRVGIWGCLG